MADKRYHDKDIIAFRNAQNEFIEAVEVRTEDTVYPVKVGKQLVQAMEGFEDGGDDYTEDDDNSTNSIDLDTLSDESISDE